MINKAPYRSFVHLLVGVVDARGAVLFLFFSPLALFSLDFGKVRCFVVLSLAGDVFGLADFVVGLTLDVATEFLLVDDPAVVLALVAVVLLLLRVAVGGEAAVEPALDAFNFVLSQLVPN